MRARRSASDPERGEPEHQRHHVARQAQARQADLGENGQEQEYGAHTHAECRRPRRHTTLNQEPVERQGQEQIEGQLQECRNIQLAGGVEGAQGEPTEGNTEHAHIAWNGARRAGDRHAIVVVGRQRIAQVHVVLACYALDRHLNDRPVVDEKGDRRAADGVGAFAE